MSRINFLKIIDRKFDSYGCNDFNSMVLLNWFCYMIVKLIENAPQFSI